LQRLANELHRTPAEILASLLNLTACSPATVDPIVAFLASGEFCGAFTAAEKYLALLSWVATRHPSEFSEFIRNQSAGRRYLTMTRAEILEMCRQNEARQIDGTQYWAIMNLDELTKRRFVGRLLEFIGYREAVIAVVCAAFGGTVVNARQRVAVLV
jgi:negative modulator of initiation of replication